MERCKITRIADHKDDFSWAEISCFYRPFNICLASYQDFLNTVPILYQLHMIDRYYYDVTESDDFVNLLCCHEFDVSSEEVNEKDLDSYLYTQIDKGKIAIIPFDSSLLHYTTNYKVKFSPHYLLVKGYNRDTGIFYITDCMQNEGSTEYKHFTIPNDTLVRGYAKFFSYFIGCKISCFSINVSNKMLSINVVNTVYKVISQLLKYGNGVSGLFELLEKKYSCAMSMADKNYFLNEIVRVSHSFAVLAKSLCVLAGIPYSQAELSNKFVESGKKLAEEILNAGEKGSVKDLISDIFAEVNQSIEDFYHSWVFLIECNPPERYPRENEQTDFFLQRRNTSSSYEEGRAWLSIDGSKIYQKWLYQDNAPQLIATNLPSNFIFNATIEQYISANTDSTFTGFFFESGNVGLQFGLSGGYIQLRDNSVLGRDIVWRYYVGNSTVGSITTVKQNDTFTFSFYLDGREIDLKHHFPSELDSAGIMLRSWEASQAEVLFSNIELIQ
ncbi:BtrH N-terminal domain-containing protein [Photorhabdus tasmaniensis]